MMAVVGKAWGWLRSSWGNGPAAEKTTGPTAEGQKQHAGGGWGLRGWTSWIWGGQRLENEQSSPVEEYWEAEEKLQSMDIKELGAQKRGTVTDSDISRWWDKYLLTTYIWPRKKEVSGVKLRKNDDTDGDFSDYGTPPPSPTPSSKLTSPFRLFVDSWMVDILPEHYEICFNFLRHLFDLFVVGFLWTVSPPAKLILEGLGVQGALRLWLHGMAMFFVSTVGMAGLLWLIQEYLPQFALIYGIIQALVISVSVQQSVILGVEEEKPKKGKEAGEVTEDNELKDKAVSAADKMKTNNARC
ncbi:uncharacterized protein C6orf47 homolog [Pholidichthys leucotaenia]